MLGRGILVPKNNDSSATTTASVSSSSAAAAAGGGTGGVNNQQQQPPPQQQPKRFVIPSRNQIEGQQPKVGSLAPVVVPKISSEESSNKTTINSQQQQASSSSTSSSSNPQKLLQAPTTTSTAAAATSDNNNGNRRSFAAAFSFVSETANYVPPEQDLAKVEAEIAAVQAKRVATEEERKPRPRRIDPRTLLVSKRQQGNSLLRNIVNVPWEFIEIIPDFILSPTACALYLSFKFHILHPTYILTRMEEAKRGFSLKILLCLVDVEESQKILIELEKASVINGWTIVCAWSVAEAGRYLETFKAYENKQADAIQERQHTDFVSRSIAGIAAATTDQMALCPGLGEKKIKRIHAALHEPFKRTEPQIQTTTTAAAAASSSGNQQQQQINFDDTIDDEEYFQISNSP